MAGYTRNDTSNNIANGNVIDADDLDGEFNAIVSAFNESTGHTHDGSTAEGAPITVTGPAQEYLYDGVAVYPKTDDTYDLGKVGAEWKDLYVDGTAYLDAISADSLVATTADINGGTVDATVIGGATPAAGTFTSLSANISLSVTGDITVTGTVDGRDLAADGTKLDGIEASADVTDTDNVTAAGALMDSELTDITAVKALNQGVATTDSPSFAGLTVDTNTLFVDSVNNRVGIGTTTPTTTVEVKAETPVMFLEATGTGVSNNPALKFKNATTTGLSSIQFGDTNSAASGSISYTHATDFMSFVTNGAEQMRIDSGGRVGIGTSFPQGNLHVQGDAGDVGRIYLTDGDSTGSTSSLLISKNVGLSSLIDRQPSSSLALGTADTEAMRIDSSGNVGIGTTTPSSKLEVNGTVTVTTVDLGNWTVTESAGVLYFATGGVNKMKLDATGNLTVVGDVTAFGTI